MTMTPTVDRSKNPSTKWADFKDDEGLLIWFKSAYSTRLVEVLIDAEKQLMSSRLADYDTPSWAYKQADVNGRLAIIKLLKDLLLA